MSTVCKSQTMRNIVCGLVYLCVCLCAVFDGYAFVYGIACVCLQLWARVCVFVY